MKQVAGILVGSILFFVGAYLFGGKDFLKFAAWISTCIGLMSLGIYVILRTLRVVP